MADKILCQPGGGRNWIALYSKGESLYNVCDFEKSLIYFHRAIRTSPTKDKLDMLQKISRAEMAINNVIGSNNYQHFDILKQMEDPVRPDELNIEDNLENLPTKETKQTPVS